MSVESTIANQEKAAHGAENQHLLECILRECYHDGYLSDLQSNFRIGTTADDKQFYAQFMIQFPNRERWVIFSTTSMRSDRIKGQQWDALNLKNLDSSISNAVLAYKDDCADAQKFKQYKPQVSAIDEICSFEELKRKIQSEFYQELKDEVSISVSDEKQIEDSITQGKIWDLAGKSFETQIADILSSKEYLKDWSAGKPVTQQDNYSFFCVMMDTFGLVPKSVKCIEATAKKEEIGYLPSGGSPKTDVIATVTFYNGTDRIITISCKRSKRDVVSVHQYTADVFADVLAPEDVRLRQLLNVFQCCGNKVDLPAGTERELTEVLQPYVRKLALWVIGGIGGSVESEKQIAQYIVSYQTETGAFNAHTVEDYCDIICQQSQMFGTPFGWTYASKCRGKSIQLKAPVV